jgi:hypothetical protein
VVEGLALEPPSRSTIIKSAEANEKLQEITSWIEDNWEGRATDIAKHAAEELKRLKKIWKQKIEHANASDNLAAYHIPVVARKAGQQVLKSAGKIQAAVDTEDTVKEKVLEAVDDANPHRTPWWGGRYPMGPEPSLHDANCCYHRCSSPWWQHQQLPATFVRSCWACGSVVASSSCSTPTIPACATFARTRA